MGLVHARARAYARRVRIGVADQVKKILGTRSARGCWERVNSLLGRLGKIPGHQTKGAIYQTI
jgi:hypothetical protein